MKKYFHMGTIIFIGIMASFGQARKYQGTEELKLKGLHLCADGRTVYAFKQGKEILSCGIVDKKTAIWTWTLPEEHNLGDCLTLKLFPYAKNIAAYNCKAQRFVLNRKTGKLILSESDF